MKCTKKEKENGRNEVIRRSNPRRKSLKKGKRLQNPTEYNINEVL